MDCTKKKFMRFLLSLSMLFSTNVFYSECAERDYNFVVSSNKDEHARVLSSTKNTRDLGGYVTSMGKTTKYGKIFRSDNVPTLDQEDIKKLKDLNLVLVIDLRNSNECNKTRDGFTDVERVERLNFALNFDHVDIGKLKVNELTWDEAYIKLISDDSSKQQIKGIFDSIANASEGLIVIHCTFGKDRTGIISALILGLCGVKEDDIVNNYAVTQELLNPHIKDFSKVRNVFSTNKSIMEKFLRFINEKGGCERFLTDCCGIKKDILNKVRSRLLDD